MPFYTKNKIQKIKRIWRRRGTLGVLSFLYQNLSSAFKNKMVYQKWIKKNILTQQDITSAHQQITQWRLLPKFSVIIPVYNVEAQWLEKVIESVRNQIYTNWELCIADDASTHTHIRLILTQYSKLDPRIKVVFRTENGNISAASNSALELATGDYIALLDHDDELSIDALYENAKLINQHPDADFIYSDEDKIDIKGKRHAPFFKPNWSPEYFYTCMYTCHLGVYRTSIIREIGGFRSDYDGSQDYDLVLRVVEKTKNIYHIPKILYHWRTIPASAASGSEAKPWAYIAGQQALQAMVERSLYPGSVEETKNPGIYRVRREIIGQPLVSIIISSEGRPFKLFKSKQKPQIYSLAREYSYQKQSQDSTFYLENCIRSIQQLSTYHNIEIIVVNGYDVPQPILDNIAAPNLHVVCCNESFNFSQRLNQGAAKATGQFLLFLNENTEVINPDWLESMLEFAQQKEIGAVGAKLLSPDHKIQHVGITILEGNPCYPFQGFDSEYAGYHCSNIANKNYLAVTAACLMMRQDVFHQMEGLDENFYQNYYDVDLCLKAHQAGYRNMVTPYAQLLYYEQPNHKKGLKSKEYQLFIEKWGSYFQYLGTDPYYNPNLSSRKSNFELL
jgi:glycosyltransferase involved in cell wall biosynthesis